MFTDNQPLIIDAVAIQSTLVQLGEAGGEVVRQVETRGVPQGHTARHHQVDDVGHKGRPYRQQGSLRNGICRVPQISGEVCSSHNPSHRGEKNRKDGEEILGFFSAFLSLSAEIITPEIIIGHGTVPTNKPLGYLLFIIRNLNVRLSVNRIGLTFTWRQKCSNEKIHLSGNQENQEELLNPGNPLHTNQSDG